MAKIVFCEDDPTIQKLIRAAMRSTAHEVYVTTDGAAGLALIEQERPDLVVTDVAMPHLDGLQLADALRLRPAVASTPVVLLTAATQRSQVEEFERHGIVTHWTKPFSTAELRRRIDCILRECLAGREDDASPDMA